MTRWWFAGVVLRRDFEHFLIRRLTTTVSSPYGRCHYIGRRVSYPFRFKTATSTWQRVSVFFLTTQSCPPAAAADQIFVRCEIFPSEHRCAFFSKATHAEAHAYARMDAHAHTHAYTRARAQAQAGHTCWLTFDASLTEKSWLGNALTVEK